MAVSDFPVLMGKIYILDNPGYSRAHVSEKNKNGNTQAIWLLRLKIQEQTKPVGKKIPLMFEGREILVLKHVDCPRISFSTILESVSKCLYEYELSKKFQVETRFYEQINKYLNPVIQMLEYIVPNNRHPFIFD